MLDGVGRRIAELRRELAWTQEQFAERLGVLTQYVQRVERGRENLTVQSLVKVANALGVTVAALFEPAAYQGKRRPGRPRRSASSDS